jgi:hypothetical protein
MGTASQALTESVTTDCHEQNSQRGSTEGPKRKDGGRRVDVDDLSARNRAEAIGKSTFVGGVQRGKMGRPRVGRRRAKPAQVRTAYVMNAYITFTARESGGQQVFTSELICSTTGNHYVDDAAFRFAPRSCRRWLAPRLVRLQATCTAARTP